MLARDNESRPPTGTLSRGQVATDNLKIMCLIVFTLTLALTIIFVLAIVCLSTLICALMTLEGLRNCRLTFPLVWSTLPSAVDIMAINGSVGSLDEATFRRISHQKPSAILAVVLSWNNVRNFYLISILHP